MAIEVGLKLDMTQQRALATQNANYTQLHPQQWGQQGESGDSAPCSCETPPGASSSGVISTGNMRTYWTDYKGEHKDGQRAGAPLLWRQAETVGAAQPGEKKASFYCSLPNLKRAYKKDRETFSAKLRDNGFKMRVLI